MSALEDSLHVAPIMRNTKLLLNEGGESLGELFGILGLEIV